MTTLMQASMFKKLLTLPSSLARQPVFVAAGTLIVASSSITLWAAVLLITTLAYTPQLNDEAYHRQTNNPVVDTDAINLRHFFGLADAEPQVIVEALPTTQLNLTLAGLFTSTNKKKGGAIIIDAKKESNFFSIGEKLTGNVTLLSVHSDRIVIDRNGIYETLFIQDTQNKTNNRFATSNSQTSKANIIRQRIEQLKKQKAANDS
tara:strand:- start:292 stop:906 length:615 start_codon:yes stop_codon:yes gene_type:complete